MRYLWRGLSHQNKFPVKFIGPNLFFPWLIVFYDLTDAFVLLLFTSSTSHPYSLCRSSRWQMFFKIGVLKNFVSFTWKHLSWTLLLIKLQAWNFIKRRLLHRCFPVKCAKFLRTPFFTEHLRWLLLSMLLFMNVSSFTSPLLHFHYFLTVLLLSSFEETLSSLYHY